MYVCVAGLVLTKCWSWQKSLLDFGIACRELYFVRPNPFIHIIITHVHVHCTHVHMYTVHMYMYTVDEKDIIIITINLSGSL